MVLPEVPGLHEYRRIHQRGLSMVDEATPTERTILPVSVGDMILPKESRKTRLNPLTKS